MRTAYIGAINKDHNKTKFTVDRYIICKMTEENNVWKFYPFWDKIDNPPAKFKWLSDPFEYIGGLDYSLRLDCYTYEELPYFIEKHIIPSVRPDVSIYMREAGITKYDEFELAVKTPRNTNDNYGIYAENEDFNTT